MSQENKVRNQECSCSWRKRSLQACSKTKPLFTNLLSEKVRDFNDVTGNHKDKTEKRLWEFGKHLNFNESISSIVFRMVLIASGLFFVWRRGRFSENSGGDSRKMFLKQGKKHCIYIYGIRYFKITAHCSKRFVLSQAYHPLFVWWAVHL